MSSRTLSQRFPGHLKTLLALWISWLVIILLFQALGHSRVSLQAPDYALGWTSQYTSMATNDILQRPNLSKPFMNNQVAWDSEYYISIANAGYEDPESLHDQILGQSISQNYAFFPLYPLAMAVVAAPFHLFMEPVPAATIAGIIVSALGALAAGLALFRLVGGREDSELGLRAAFYFLVFPSAFFLAQVYTEGLFAALAFWSLVFQKEKKFLLAALFACLAFWTRLVGVALFVPMLWEAIRSVDWRYVGFTQFLRKHALRFLFALSPLVMYLVWSMTALGHNFHAVEEAFFGRKSFALFESISAWFGGFAQIFGTNSQAAMYYLIEALSLILAVVCCIVTFRKATGPALFGLCSVAICFTSAVPQGLVRYVLVVPSIYIALTQWGKNRVFDRAWTTASVLVMGLLALIFSFNLWVA